MSHDSRSAGMDSYTCIFKEEFMLNNHPKIHTPVTMPS